MNPATPRIYDVAPLTQPYQSAEHRYYFESLMDDVELSYVHGAASGVRVTERTAMRTAAVFACIRVIAESIAGIDLHVYRRLARGGHEIFPGWLDTLLSIAPNPAQTRVEFLEQILRHFEIWHRCYAEVVQGPGGTVSALQPLHPSRVKPKKLPNGRLVFVYTDNTGNQKSFSQDEMFWMHGFSDDGETGDALLELGKETIGLCRALELHAARYFGNGARPGVVLETEQNLNPETVERLRESWERIHRGPQNAHKTAILDGGVKAHEFEGSSNQDSQFTQALEFETSRVCSLFRVPPHKIQLLNRATFANVEQQEIDFRNSCIAPRCVRLEQAFARSLIADPSLFVRFDLNDLERGDSASRMQYLTAAVDRGILSVNEARAREGLNPVVGGDVHFFPLNMTTLEVMNAPVAVEAIAVQSVLDRLASGGISPEAAKVLISVQSPMMTPDQVTAIVDGARASAQPDRAQVTALLQVIDDVASGVLTPSGAIAVIGASFPQLDREQVAAIVGGVRAGVTKPEVAPLGLPGPAGASGGESSAPASEIDPTEDPLAASATGADMAATALNGAQVSSLLQVLASVTAGAINEDSAVSVITSAFPTISEEVAMTMVIGAMAKGPQPAAVVPSPAAATT